MKPLLFILSLLAITLAHAKDPIHIHMLSGSGEYKSEPSLLLWEKHLESTYDMEVTLSLGKDHSKRVEGLENLATADVLVIFCRRWELESEQASQVVEYIKSGKPVFGIRTASHAFQFFKELDKSIFGGNYKGHVVGDHPVNVNQTSLGMNHPILEGVDDWDRVGKPYYNPSIAPDVKVLLRKVAHNADEPAAWTRVLENNQKVFYTSLGVPEDFKIPEFIQLIDNALFWLLDDVSAE